MTTKTKTEDRGLIGQAVAAIGGKIESLAAGILGADPVESDWAALRAAIERRDLGDIEAAGRRCKLLPQQLALAAAAVEEAQLAVPIVGRREEVEKQLADTKARQVGLRIFHPTSAEEAEGAGIRRDELIREEMRALAAKAEVDLADAKVGGCQLVCPEVFGIPEPLKVRFRVNGCIFPPAVQEQLTKMHLDPWVDHWLIDYPRHGGSRPRVRLVNT